MTKIISDQKKKKGGDEISYYPYDKSSFIEEARIGMKEVSRLADVTAPQVQYWEKQNYIPSEGTDAAGENDHYRYSYETVKKATLIRQGLEKGLSLSEAVKKADDFLKNHDERDIGKPRYKLVRELITEKTDEIASLLLEEIGREDIQS